MSTSEECRRFDCVLETRRLLILIVLERSRIDVRVRLEEISPDGVAIEIATVIATPSVIGLITPFNGMRGIKIVVNVIDAQ